MKTIKLLLSIMIITLIIPINITAKEYDLSNYTDEEAILIKEMIDTNPEFNLEDGEILAVSQVILKETYDGNVITRGPIGNDYMKLTVYAQRITGDKGYDSIKLQAKADWLKVPVFNFNDGLALAWSDDFAQYSHSCTTRYYRGEASDTSRQISSDPKAGIGYSFQFMNGKDNPLDYVILTADVRKADSSGEVVVSATYVHSKLSFSIGFSFASSSISITGGGLYDQAATDSTFRY